MKSDDVVARRVRLFESPFCRAAPSIGSRSNAGDRLVGVHRRDDGRTNSVRIRRLPMQQPGAGVLLQQTVLGGSELGYHELRQLRLGHVDGLPVRYARGLDGRTLQRKIHFIHRETFNHLGNLLY